MLLTISKNQYNKINILYSDKTKNNILSNGFFYRIYFSNNHFTTNGLYILLNFKNIKIDKYFDKIKCIIDRTINKNITDFISNVEYDLLMQSPIKYKTPKFRIDEQLKQNFIKIFGSHNILQKDYENLNILLKISGIWVDETHYGVTFRFFIQDDLSSCYK